MATAVVEKNDRQIFRMNPMRDLQPSKTNPRRTFDARHQSELEASIKEKGILVPLLVRTTWSKIGDKEPQQYEVVAGERRWRAARAAGLAEVPCIVRELSDEQALEVQVIENLQRADVHPIEEADGYARLLKLGKHDVATIANKVGKSKEYVYGRLKLAQLIAPAKEAFTQEKITAGHAILIARLQPKEQERALRECAPSRQSDDAMSVRGLAEWIEEEVHLELNRAPWKLEDATLVPAAGACTSCEKKASRRERHDSRSAERGSEQGQELRGATKEACLDPGCYENKLKAHLVRLEAKLGTEGQKVVRISGEYYTRGAGGPLSANSWKRAEPGSCKHVATGLVVQGSYGYGDGVKRGQIIMVCPDQRCREHWPADRPSGGGVTRSPAERWAERKERAVNEARTEAVRQIGMTKKWPLARSEERRV